MRRAEERADARRRAWLLRALAAGALAAPAVALGQPLGRVPGPLPPGRSIYNLRGRVTVDGRAADERASVTPRSTVETGARSSVTFVVGADAFILRENSRMTLGSESSAVVSLLRLATGALLSVFGQGRKSVATPTATLGIRGTGLYLEADPEKSYVCLCYGTSDLAAADAPEQQERLESRHHDVPRYVLGPQAARRIVPAGFINHSDLELMLLENLVGRAPPFSLFDESYSNPRRY